MDIVSEVLAFSREYVNGNQTNERRQKIASAYRQLFGEKMRIGCSTCYIEAIFKIKRFMEKPSCKYRLKPGALLRTFGDESKTCTNNTLTDELAEFHIRTNPGCIKWFSVPSPDELQRIFFTPSEELEIVPATVEVNPDSINETEIKPKKPGRKPKS